MKINRAALIASSLLLIFVSVCMLLVFKYVASEKQRDLQNWQDRLGVIAESQKRSIDSDLLKQLELFHTLASNPLVQIYFSEIEPGDAADLTEVQSGQLHHLKNLLNATARSSALLTPVKPVNNNKPQAINDGLALVNKNRILLSTRYFPVNEVKVGKIVTQVLRQKKSIVSDIYSDSNGQPRFMIAVPVRAVQAMTANDLRGVIVAVINPEQSLYKITTRHWLTTFSDETILAIKHANVVTYISPLESPYALFHQQSADNSNLATVYAVNHPGGFALKRDYKNKEVLVTSRRISGTDWILVQKINTSEALQESVSHQRFILIILLLAIFFITVSFIAIWRNATSLRLQKITDRLKSRTELLNAIGDSITDYIFLLDSNQKLVLVNHALCQFLEANADDVKGKALNHLYDVDTTKRLLEIRHHKDVKNREIRLEINNRRYDYHVTVVALRYKKYQQSHLYVLHDITDLKDTQGRHNRMMEAIIQTLVRLTDIHDPYCAHHSERTREVAVAIAEVMNLPREKMNALSMAALLANVGKLSVPAEILTSVETLTPEASSILHKSNQYSVEILQGLEFEGPVVEFVKQKNEHLDGSGYPEGLSGESIHQESRILAVANAFVAMSSSRAYRPGKAIKEVLELLFEQADSHYDRQVIAALLYAAESRPGWKDWRQVK